ncbi:hypothetical protein IV102_20370 [bacterium]|nr:hypothetical protein [bacterium]
MPFVPLWQFVVAFFCNLIYVGLYYQMDDEAYCVLAAARILEGELPYRDFLTHITPGSYFITAAFLSVTGFNPLAVRGLLALLVASIGTIVQALADKSMPASWRYLPWLVWSTSGVYTHHILNYHWFGTLAIMAGVYWAVAWLERPTRRRGLAFGACGGLAMWIIQSAGLALALVAVVLWLRFRPKGLGWVGVGALLSSLVLWLPLLPWWAGVWQDNVLAMGRHLASARSSFDPGMGWRATRPLLELAWLQDPLFSLGVATRAWLAWERYIFYYPVLLMGLWLAERRRHRIAAALAWSLVAWDLTFLSRQTLPYLGYTSPLYLLVLLRLLSGWRWFRWQQAVIAATLVTYLLRGYELRQRYIYPIPTRTGLYWGVDPLEAAAMQLVHQWVSTKMPPGTRVLAYPYFTSLYTTEYLRNGCREPLFVEGAFGLERLQACVRELRDRDVQHLVVMPLVPEAVGQVSAISVPDYLQARKQWLQIVTQDYQLVEKRGFVSLYRRRPKG